MSSFETHLADQDEITAACDAGTCNHPDCHATTPERTGAIPAHGPWMLAWTLNFGRNDLRDHFSIESNEADARTALAKLIATVDNLHCAACGPIAVATEPHWTEPGAV